MCVPRTARSPSLGLGAERNETGAHGIVPERAVEARGEEGGGSGLPAQGQAGGSAEERAEMVEVLLPIVPIRVRGIESVYIDETGGGRRERFRERWWCCDRWRASDARGECCHFGWI